MQRFANDDDDDGTERQYTVMRKSYCTRFRRCFFRPFERNAYFYCCLFFFLSIGQHPRRTQVSGISLVQMCSDQVKWDLGKGAFGFISSAWFGTSRLGTAVSREKTGSRYCRFSYLGWYPELEFFPTLRIDLENLPSGGELKNGMIRTSVSFTSTGWRIVGHSKDERTRKTVQGWPTADRKKNSLQHEEYSL